MRIKLFIINFYAHVNIKGVQNVIGEVDDSDGDSEK